MHDGVYDLALAHAIARRRGITEAEQRELIGKFREMGLEFTQFRIWHPITGKDLSIYARQILRKTLDSVDRALTDQFGQSRGFFTALPTYQK